MSMLFYLGIMLLGGLLFGRLAKKVGLPNVTGYLVAGLIVGPYVLKIIPADAASSISMVSEMALGFIALSIGAEFKLSYFREVGVRPVVIAILEGLCAMGAVVCGLLFAGQTLAFSLVLGAIASATAPAATIMVIRQYNANGPLTKTLLSVVALDDAVALIAFGFAVTVAKTLNSASDVNIAMSIAEPFIELGISIVVGAAAAAVSIVSVFSAGSAAAQPASNSAGRASAADLIFCMKQFSLANGCKNSVYPLLYRIRWFFSTPVLCYNKKNRKNLRERFFL